MAPVLEPLNKYLHKIRVLQVTMFVLMLGLFVPDDLPHAAAIHLNMHRRRTVLLLLSHWHTYEWEYIWCKRKWSYLGHLLRKDPGDITQQSVYALLRARQARPGPWAHILQWGKQQLGHVGIVDAPVGEVAQNRTHWQNLGQLIGDNVRLAHPLAKPCDLQQWRDVFRLSVDWHLGAFFHLSLPSHRELPDGQYTVLIGWLHDEHGMQTFTRDGDVMSVLFLWLSYLQFEFAGLSVELFMEEWIYDSHNLQFQQLHHDVLEVFTKVVSCQIISSEVGVKLLGLL